MVLYWCQWRSRTDYQRAFREVRFAMFLVNSVHVSVLCCSWPVSMRFRRLSSQFINLIYPP